MVLSPTPAERREQALHLAGLRHARLLASLQHAERLLTSFRERPLPYASPEFAASRAAYLTRLAAHVETLHLLTVNTEMNIAWWESIAHWESTPSALPAHDPPVATGRQGDSLPEAP